MTLILNLSIVKCHINLHFYILNTKYCCHANLRMNHICTAFCFIKYKYIINTLNFQELHFSIQFTSNSCINHFPFSHTSSQKPQLIKANVKKITAFAVKFVNWPTNVGNEKGKLENRWTMHPLWQRQSTAATKGMRQQENGIQKKRVLLLWVKITKREPSSKTHLSFDRLHKNYKDTDCDPAVTIRRKPGNWELLRSGICKIKINNSNVMYSFFMTFLSSQYIFLTVDISELFLCFFFINVKRGSPHFEICLRTQLVMILGWRSCHRPCECAAGGALAGGGATRWPRRWACLRWRRSCHHPLAPDPPICALVIAPGHSRRHFPCWRPAPACVSSAWLMDLIDWRCFDFGFVFLVLKYFWFCVFCLLLVFPFKWIQFFTWVHFTLFILLLCTGGEIKMKLNL